MLPQPTPRNRILLLLASAVAVWLAWSLEAHGGCRPALALACGLFTFQIGVLAIRRLDS